VITVVYIHGWKNNAAEAAPGGKPKDVEKFQAALLELASRAQQRTPTVPVVGIYLAWRGKTLMGPNWFTAASLWSRRNTANNIGDGPDVARILNDIIEHTNKGNDRSRVLLIGHSFGARVLEHAIESDRVKLYDTVDSRITPRVDLVLYVNSANDSRLSMGRIRALRESKLRVHHPDYDEGECGAVAAAARDDEARSARCRDYPLIVAITSKGDSATKQLLPIANTINGDSLIPALQEKLDKLPALPASNDFADRTPSAGTIRKVAAGHFGFLQSHVAREITCPALPPPLHLVVFHFLLTDEGAGPLLGLQYASDFQFPIRSHHRIGIDGKVHRHLPHRGKLITRRQTPTRDPAQYLIDDLPVHRHAAVQIQPEFKAPVLRRVAHLT